MDKNVPLSELIRIGSKITEQHYGQLTSKGGSKTCALGAATTAKFGQFLTQDKISAWRLSYDEIRKFNRPIRHPINNEMNMSHNIIVSLNDDYMWTREQIADWLQSIGL